MTLDELNQMDTAKAQTVFSQCCSASRWVEKMVAARPFDNQQALHEAADNCWQGLEELDFLQAFDGHPKIGDVNSLRAKYANTKTLACGEQSAVNQANEQVLDALAQGNQDYLEKFGFIFIVCATGKSAQQMLTLLRQRLPNNRAQELLNGAEQQRQIFQIRLEKLLT